jgi:multicomponent Na+:H+ antiporter subunit G
MSILLNTLMVCSALLIFGSAMGALRFPNAIMRLHATAKAGGLAATLLLIASFISNPSFLLAGKIVFIVIMIIFTTAQAAHVIAKSTLVGSIMHPKHGHQNETELSQSPSHHRGPSS